jgi:hypothetical protein
MTAQVIKKTFNKKQAAQEDISQAIIDMDFENLLVMGTKGTEIFALFAGKMSLMEVIGMLEIAKTAYMEDA